jgi:hypothetical protein
MGSQLPPPLPREALLNHVPKKARSSVDRIFWASCSPVFSAELGEGNLRDTTPGGTGSLGGPTGICIF